MTALLTHFLWQLYKPDIEGSMDAICDYVFNETVIAYSHENIRNFGHSMLADMMNVWSSLWLSSNTRNSKVYSNINIRQLRNLPPDCVS